MIVESCMINLHNNNYPTKIRLKVLNFFTKYSIINATFLHRISSPSPSTHSPIHQYLFSLLLINIPSPPFSLLPRLLPRPLPLQSPPSSTSAAAAWRRVRVGGTRGGAGTPGDTHHSILYDIYYIILYTI